MEIPSWGGSCDGINSAGNPARVRAKRTTERAKVRGVSIGWLGAVNLVEKWGI